VDIRYEGWTFTMRDGLLLIAKDAAPGDRDGDGVFYGYHDSFVTSQMADVDVYTRAFCTLQYLNDHELREQFTVDGARPFDPHSPTSLTGFQKDWFVEHRSALRGY
jgi:hypothetical protein